MSPFNKTFYYAVFALIGTIIGAGIFGLPYVVQKAGFTLGLFWLIFLGLVTLYLHLMYGEIVLRTPGKHRYTGFVRKYFSKQGSILASIINIIGTFGVLLAYLVVGGVFLFNLFYPLIGGRIEMYSLIFFVWASLGVIFSIPLFHKINSILVGLLLLIFIVIGFWGAPLVKAENLLKIDGVNFFFPYGVILFALGGGSAIPEMVEILKKRPYKIKKAIIIGTLVPLFIFILFTFAVVGISGSSVAPDAISSLELYLGRPIVIFGSAIGLLAVITSFFTIGMNLKKIFWYDYKINKYLAAFLTLFIPLGMFFAGAKNFVEIISLLGVFMSGIDGILMAKLFYAARKRGKKRVSYRLPFASWMPYTLVVIFILGMISEIYFETFK